MSASSDGINRANQEVRHWDLDDEVDQASIDSFPASDPPAWTSSRAAPTAQSAAALECEVQAISTPSWLRRHVREVALGVAVAGALVHGVRRMRRAA